MSSETAFIESLRALAADPAARGLLDDAAVLEVGGATLVLTHDCLAEGVHFLPDDPPGDVAWKLVAVNLSDLAAKGARPVGVMLGYSLGDEGWDRAFGEGLGKALAEFGLPLLGGDTIRAPRVLGMTAIGEARGPVPPRSGAQPGDSVWVSGTLGDAGAGLRMLNGDLTADPRLVGRYRRPLPRIEAGERLAPVVSAMMDVSDGLLIDASRLAGASRVCVEIDLALLPLSVGFDAALRRGREARLFAATAGDDYELLFTAAPAVSEAVDRVARETGLPMTRIGRVVEGAGLGLREGPHRVELPDRLGWEHV